eukprot:6692721-Prymnesium_polylepis.1
MPQLLMPDRNDDSTDAASAAIHAYPWPHMPMALASFMICGRSWSHAAMTTMLTPACLMLCTAGA